jgi:NAD(P)-dependent dehydrogenase (short-subunit alcohol dehydrogenase family)
MEGIRTGWCGVVTGMPDGHMGDALDVAHAALFPASDEAKYFIGTEMVVDGGLTVNCI